MKTIHLKCGHDIRVREWPSVAGLAKVRRHYAEFHPHKMKAITQKALRTKRKKGLIAANPRSSVPADAVEIYDDILAIEATKGKKSLWPNEEFRHDFSEEKGKAKIYGLSDGSLLIKGKKRLWNIFDYGGGGEK